MVEDEQILVDWKIFTAARQELGAGFIRILGYFREDGAESVARVEQALRAGDAAAMVLPAHRLKGESRLFGAGPLAELAEEIEGAARRCVEAREVPGHLIPQVVALRQVFDKTLGLFDRECNPLVERRQGFGRRGATGHQDIDPF